LIRSQLPAHLASARHSIERPESASCFPFHSVGRQRQEDAARFLSPRARLAAENLLLRQQLVILRRITRRPRFKPWERRLLSSIAVRWSALQNAVLLVKPATLLRWHRTAWRCGGGENRNDGLASAN
jgi:hypothetical protein